MLVTAEKTRGALGRWTARREVVLAISRAEKSYRMPSQAFEAVLVRTGDYLFLCASAPTSRKHGADLACMRTLLPGEAWRASVFTLRWR
jgi:hypothetical protein